MKNYRFIGSGNHIIIGGDILPTNLLKVNQYWLAGKSLAKIIIINQDMISYRDCSSDEIFERDSFGFQSRYCLIVNPSEMEYYSLKLNMNLTIEDF
jgi:hypothetical protein